jgi:hypothetical protein
MNVVFNGLRYGIHRLITYQYELAVCCEKQVESSQRKEISSDSIVAYKMAAVLSAYKLV